MDNGLLSPFYQWLYGTMHLNPKWNWRCVKASQFSTCLDFPRPIWIWKCAFACVITNNATHTLSPNFGPAHYSICQMTADSPNLWMGGVVRKDTASQLRPFTVEKYGIGLQPHVKSRLNQNRSPIIPINLLLAFNIILPSFTHKSDFSAVSSLCPALW